MRGTCLYVLGLGGEVLDPGGASELKMKIEALGVRMPPLFTQDNLQPIYDAAKKLPSGELLILGGDSCGVSRITAVAKAIYPRRVDYLFGIQGSYWCTSGSAPILDNVAKATFFYSSWLRTWGLGVWKPPLANPPVTKYYDGEWHLGNAGHTQVRYIYTPDLHPGDNDVTGVQNPIIQDIRELL